ncbi:hypothetical protein TanjilG_32426 [Lupinus angustifolius]|uniref:Receptor-like PK ALE2 N-terminal domain-containing protein n=1 Tax=Lupinus angustifolius TaxID=3871 RepID=A0A394DDW4_LUPAN|nr:hypothetical protein TanjilG_32426 [Lupinus angustifolius]
MSVPLALSERAQMWLGQPSSMSSVAPGPPPSYRGHSVTTTPKLHRHHPNMQPYPVAPSLSKGQDPLTATPFGSPCGCVFPMKVRLVLDIAPLPIFPVINELEIEVASGTYLKQSQVRIMGVSADSENQGRTIVDINLVPLGEKFDDITFSVICERFWHKKVPLNKSLFGDFEVLSITYPDMPASAPHGPFVSDGNHPDPSSASVSHWVAPPLFLNMTFGLLTVVSIAKILLMEYRVKWLVTNLFILSFCRLSSPNSFLQALNLLFNDNAPPFWCLP